MQTVAEPFCDIDRDGVAELSVPLRVGQVVVPGVGEPLQPGALGGGEATDDLTVEDLPGPGRATVTGAEGLGDAAVVDLVGVPVGSTASHDL